MSLVLRQVKGSKLTIQEGDNNFTYLESLSNKYKPSASSFFDVSNTASTTFTGSSVWTPLISNSQAGLNINGVISLAPSLFSPGNYGYQYIIPGVGTPSPGIFKFEAALSISGGNNKIIQVALFKDAGNTGNPTIWPCSLQEATLPSGGRPTQIIVQCLVNLVQGDTTSLFIQNTTDSTTIDLFSLNIIWSRYLI